MKVNRRTRKTGKDTRLQLNLKDHCIFCLKQCTPVTARDNEYINPFKLLRYLFGNRSVNESVISREAPPMCQSCYSIFEELLKLHEQVRAVQRRIQIQLGEICQVVSETRASSSSKWGQIKNTLESSGVAGEEVNLTRMLVNNLHELIEERRVGPKITTAKEETTQVQDSQDNHDPLEDNFFQMNEMDPAYTPLWVVDANLPGEDPISSEDVGLYLPNESQASNTSWETSCLRLEQVTKKKTSKPKRVKDEDEDWTDKTEERKKKATAVKNLANQKVQIAPRTGVRGKKRIRYKVPIGPQQKCDLCGAYLRRKDIFEHLREHVGDFATKCPSPFCKYSFSCKLKMIQHVANDSRCKQVVDVEVIRDAVCRKCESCGHESATPFDLANHLKTHEVVAEEEGKTECPVEGCGEKFLLKQSLECHLFYHDLRSPTYQKCPVCKERWEIEEVEEHLAESHQVTETFKCNICSIVFVDVDEKIKHLRRHRNEDGVPCDICGNDSGGFRFRREETLRLHYVNIHNLGTLTVKDIVCSECGAECASTASLKQHNRLHHNGTAGPAVPVSTKRFKCDLCSEEKDFCNRQSLINHKIKVHGAAYLPCKICGETFPSTNILENHLRMHAGTIQSFKCKEDGCEKEYKTRRQLRVHVESAHWKGDALPYICNLCGRGYRTKSGLKHHKDASHFGIRPVCDQCGENFASEKVLNLHKLIHTGERPHKCPICGQAFRQKGVLQTHLKSHERRGDNFKPNGPMKKIRKRTEDRKVTKIETVVSLPESTSAQDQFPQDAVPSCFAPEFGSHLGFFPHQ